PTKNINEGVFTPLKILTDDTSIISAQRPAPVSMNFEGRLGGADLIWKSLAPHLPHQLPAGHLLSVSSVVISGEHPDTEEPFLLVEPSVGGWGAGNGQDGQRGQFCMGDGETYNVPIEVAEARYGVQVISYSLRCDGGGAGDFIGGSGVIRTYKALNDNQNLTASYGRHQYAPWRVNREKEGGKRYIKIKKTSEEVIGPLGVVKSTTLNKGDVVELATATGGVYGNPENRPIYKLKQDLKNGYISNTDIKQIYQKKL